MTQQQTNTNAAARATSLKGKLNDIVKEARAGIEQLDDAKAQALFETTAEVVSGLVVAIDHYENRSEPAWR